MKVDLIGETLGPLVPDPDEGADWRGEEEEQENENHVGSVGLPYLSTAMGEKVATM